MSTKPKENSLGMGMSAEPVKENLYQLLNISPSASISEIIQAYRQARQAFSEGSLATYSLMAEREKKDLLDNLEYAYLTLTNPEKRRLYDRQLTSKAEESSDGQAAGPILKAVEEEGSPSQPTPSSPFAGTTAPAPTLQGKVTGAELRRVREQLSYTLEDVARITKIPKRFLQAMESEDVPKMPAHVYVQGFLTNVAQLYKLNPRTTVEGFLERLRVLKS